MIRPAHEGDAAAIAAVYAPYVTDGVVSFELDPPDAAEMARRMAVGGERHPWLVAEENGRVLGYVYASTFRSRAAMTGRSRRRCTSPPTRKDAGSGARCISSCWRG